MDKIKLPDMPLPKPQPIAIPVERDLGIKLNGSVDYDDGSLIKKSDRNILFKSNNKIF